MSALAKIALDTLAAEFDSHLGPMQLQYEPVDWLNEFFEAIQLVYLDTPISDTSTTPIRSAFVEFAHKARFYLLQNETFTKLLDEAPVFALDMFRTMRQTGDFIAHLPEPHCSNCRNKPTRGDKPYYTHLAPDKLRLTVSCHTCAVKKELPPGTENWLGKK